MQFDLRIHYLFYIQTIVITGKPYQPQFYWFEFGRLFGVAFFHPQLQDWKSRVHDIDEAICTADLKEAAASHVCYK